ncbi:hypothetical protein SAMN04487770_1188 [Butyrivibrio sp. ob235]|uniref:hypothetical protein n=1 Tax=Butyrivibrio sp. ob235 TaxID=1761780 RepID=UPI0008BB13DD|nr:hypothetical protein [Butyrivibrio sp. ob235]SEL81086.1 hypothetical protein SAMN04487770_1188 [Butyrivibrio sp. ob235]
MSQEKVDAYKIEKKGRKARIAKHKRNVKIAKCVSLVLLLAVCSLVGWRVYAAKHPTADAAATEISEDVVPAAETVDGTEATAETTDGTETVDETETSTDAADETTDAN